MKPAIAFVLAMSAAIAAAQDQGKAFAVAELMQSWQARIVAQGLPVEDAKNWSRRNMAKFGRLNAERLAIAQRASTLEELELALLDAPLPHGARLDVLMANKPGNIAMMPSRARAKSSPDTSPSSYANLTFTAVTTCRILDSRPSQGGTGPWAALSSNTVKIGPYEEADGGYQTGPGAQGGSPTGCGLDALAGPGQVAVILAAVSTVSQSGPGYLTFYPQGSPNPGLTAVSQFYQPGSVQTSFVLIPTDLVGTVAASGFTSATTQVIIDVVGYFSNDGNVKLVHSTADTGNILKNGIPWLHDFGSQNLFIGIGSGNFTMTGTGVNTGVGWATFSGNTTGALGTATGAYALATNTTGSGNTASGYIALGNNTTGSSNTAMGMQALYQNATGAGNTASGVFSLFSSTNGSSNTAHGFNSLGANSTGSNNTAVGYNAGAGLTTGNFNIDIGNPGLAAESNTIRIGDGNQSRAFVSGIRGTTTGTADAVSVFIDSNGQLGTLNSSLRVKDDVADMASASSALMKLRPVTFHYRSDQAPAGRTLQYGLIAEEVANVYPGLIAHSADGKIETVMYQFLPPMLLNEVQKQQRTIEAQAKEIAALKAAVEKLMNR